MLILLSLFFWSKIPGTPVVYLGGLSEGNVPHRAWGTLHGASLSRRQSLIHQLRPREYLPPLRTAQHANKGVFSGEMWCNFRLYCWIGEVPGDEPRAPHTFRTWTPKMRHLPDCLKAHRCVMWSPTLPFTELGFVLFSHYCKGWYHLPTWRDNAIEGQKLCCMLLLNTQRLPAQPWAYLTC